MSNFFDNVETSNNFEMGGGDFDPLPKGTRCIAIIEEAKWSEFEGKKTISIRWSVAKPEMYKNRKIFQKLDVLSPEKGLKAKKMLAAIDANAGGTLMAAGTMPTDQLLTKALCFKTMQIKLEVWDMNGKSGNWVCAVSAKGDIDEPKAAVVPSFMAGDTNDGLPF